ncbi:MAG: 7-cyano-7-deazaguanine synthase, partial [Bacteroidales bacterium]
SMKSTVIENRNIIFASIIYGKALSWSKKSGKETQITLGIHTGDHTIYPDCTVQSQKAAERAFKISNWGSEKVSYIAPFNKTDKSGILTAGITAMHRLGLSEREIIYVLKNTHTCYNPDSKGRSCGICGSCRERAEAFAANGIKDPTGNHLTKKI